MNILGGMCMEVAAMVVFLSLPMYPMWSCDL